MKNLEYVLVTNKQISYLKMMGKMLTSFEQSFEVRILPLYFYKQLVVDLVVVLEPVGYHTPNDYAKAGGNLSTPPKSSINKGLK